jgi:hypothetical protein
MTMTEVPSSLFLARRRKKKWDGVCCFLGSLYGVGDVLAGIQENATKLAVIRCTEARRPHRGFLFHLQMLSNEYVHVRQVAILIVRHV